jgi:hypothetical protein
MSAKTIELAPSSEAKGEAALSAGAALPARTPVVLADVRR